MRKIHLKKHSSHLFQEIGIFPERNLRRTTDITQRELSDPIKDPKLSKNKGELLFSRLQQWNILDDTVNVTAFRSRKKIFSRSS
jgi:hypothetical protein